MGFASIYAVLKECWAAQGVSLIKHAGQPWYLGPYRRGLWSDRNDQYLAAEDTGYGVKLDLHWFRWVDLIPYFWKLDYWRTGDSIVKIRDIPLDQWVKVFGQALAQRLLQKRLNGVPPGGDPPPLELVYDYKYSYLNEWKGLYLMSYRIPIRFPVLFFSVSTPWRSLYLGFKTYSVEPQLTGRHYTQGQGDYTWAYRYGEEDFRACCLTGSCRDVRNK